MRGFTKKGGRFGIALCAVALVAQAAVLPALHAEHSAGATLELVLALTAPASDAAAVGACDHARAAGHDLTSCPLCATFGRTGAALVPVAVMPGTPPEQAERVWARANRPIAAPDIARGAPRGPPALVS